MLQILLAEDNYADVLLVQQALRAHDIGCELHVARDGEQALNYVTHMGQPGGMPCPDLLLLDLNLPKADGAQVLREFRQHPECASTPVIIVTSSDAPNDRASVNQLGVSRYFLKPLDLDAFLQLGETVREVIAVEQSRDRQI
jgi:CheY-like chemotaxis protein